MANDLGLPPLTEPHPDYPPPVGADATLLAQATALRDAHLNLAFHEQRVAEAKHDIERLSRIDVVEAMRDAQRESVTLLDGTVVLLDHRLHCRIRSGEKIAVCQWLRDRGLSDMLTVTLSVAFKRTEWTLAQQFLREGEKLLAEMKAARPIDAEWDVHSATLKAYVVKHYLAGKAAALHPGIDYFDGTCAVVRAPQAPAEAEDVLA